MLTKHCLNCYTTKVHIPFLIDKWICEKCYQGVLEGKIKKSDKDELPDYIRDIFKLKN